MSDNLKPMLKLSYQYSFLKLKIDRVHTAAIEAASFNAVFRHYLLEIFLLSNDADGATMRMNLSKEIYSLEIMLLSRRIYIFYNYYIHKNLNTKKICHG